jgi:hypothetical protein
MGFHPLEIAFPFGTLHRLVLDLQAGADRFKLVGGAGATAVGDEKLWDPIAQTGGREDHPRHPTGFRGRHRAGQHGP